MLGVGIGERTLNNGQHLDLSCLEDWQLGEIFNQRRNDPDFLETSGHALTRRKWRDTRSIMCRHKVDRLQISSCRQAYFGTGTLD